MFSGNMKIKDLDCELHMPAKLKSNVVNGEEIAQSLPPFALVNAFAVDEYPGCPSNWMNGSDIASSYFLPVEEGKGMWLNFNNCSSHTHDVAVVISIQGINPITGQKTEVLRLEQYKKNCPIHNVPFQQEMFCPDCKFKWPAQNYLCTTGTPSGLFWLDGFRNPNGAVRQYIFTSEEIKGIAHQLIGDEKVYAIGIAFYLSKEKKPEPTQKIKSSNVDIFDKLPFYKPYSYPINPIKKITYDSKSYDDFVWKNSNKFSSKPLICYHSTSDTSDRKITCSANTNKDYQLDKIAQVSKINGTKAHKVIEDDIVCEKIEVEEINPVEKLEIGAGALIKQRVYSDPKPMDYWENKPQGMIYINYCDKKTFNKIIAAGKRKEKKEGFMEELNVGS